VFKVIKISQ
jgi:serine/threonine protein kinase